MDEEKTTNIESMKKFSKEERKKIREKRRAEQGAPTKMNRYLYFVLFFASIVNFFDNWCTLAITIAMGNFSGAIDILGILLKEDLFSYFGITGSPITMGIILSIAGTGVVAAVSFRYLGDKYGRRPLVLWTSVFFILFSILTGLSPPSSQGLIMFLIFRIASNYFLSADIVIVIMAEEAPDSIRGRLIGTVLALGTMGGSVCGIIQSMSIHIDLGGVILKTWQSMFFLTIIGYIFVIPLYFFLKETNRFKSMKKYEDWRKKKGLKPKIGWLAPLKRQYIRGMVAGCVIGFLGNLIYFAQITFFALFYNKELGMSPEMVGLASLPSTLGAALGYFLGGPIVDRWGRIPTIHRFGTIAMVSTFFFTVPAIFVIPGLSNPLAILFILIGAVAGIFCLTITVTAGAVVGMELFPTHIRSTAAGWVGAISRGAVIVAPLLTMWGAEKIGGLGLSYMFMFFLTAYTSISIMFSVYLLIPESKGRQLEEIVATEIYTKMKRSKDYNKPYIFYTLGFVTLTACSIIFGLTTGAPILNVIIMVGIFATLSGSCFLIVVKARSMITE